MGTDSPGFYSDRLSFAAASPGYTTLVLLFTRGRNGTSAGYTQVMAHRRRSVGEYAQEANATDSTAAARSPCARRNGLWSEDGGRVASRLPPGGVSLRRVAPAPSPQRTLSASGSLLWHIAVRYLEDPAGTASPAPTPQRKHHGGVSGQAMTRTLLRSSINTLLFLLRSGTTWLQCPGWPPMEEHYGHISTRSQEPSV
jgi:hypothetical protein